MNDETTTGSIMEQIHSYESLQYIGEYAQKLPVTNSNKIDIDFTDFTKYLTDQGINIDIIGKEDFITMTIKHIQKICSERNNNTSNIEVMLNNVPETFNRNIDLVGAEDIGRLVRVTGTITAVAEPTTKAIKSTYNCLICDRIITVEDSPYPPTVCDECGGRNFIFREDLSSYGDVIEVLVEETNTEKTNQRKLKVVIEGSLTKTVDINQEVEIVGIVSRDTESTKKDNKPTMIKANNVTLAKSNTVQLTDEDIKELEELSLREDIIDIIATNLLPNMVFKDEIKKALACYLVKGSSIGNIERSEIHIFIIADPSTGKSTVAKNLMAFMDKYSYADGTSSTGVGLTGAVVKNSILNTTTLNLGAFPKANHGHCILDEFDKLPVDQRSIILNALEHNLLKIDKAEIHKEIETHVSVLALANPNEGRWNPFKRLKDQIDFKPELLSRFDLIYVLDDKPDKTKDKKIATAMLNNTSEQNETTLDKVTLKKYIQYAREFKPTLTPKAMEYSTEYYVNIRNASVDSMDSEEFIKNADARNLGAVVRIASALAKLKLSNDITLTEIEEAIEIINYSLVTAGYDPETDTIDMDNYRGNVDNTDRQNREHILESIEALTKTTVDGRIRQSELLTYMKDNYDMSRNTFYDTIKQLEVNHIKIEQDSTRGNPMVISLK